MKFNFEIIREVNVSKDVCLWNTWDHEHLFYVHKQFTYAKILYEDSNVAFVRTKIKVPFTPIYLNALHTMTRLKDDNVLVIDTMPFGIISKLEMIYTEMDNSTTSLRNIYQLDLPCIFYPLKFLLPKLIKKWNDQNWEEDLPLKMRRQMAINMGFRDYFGIDDKKNKEYKFKLPIPRPKESILN
jgi:hypothetical protein